MESLAHVAWPTKITMAGVSPPAGATADGVRFTTIASGFGALEGPTYGADGTLYVGDLKARCVLAIPHGGHARKVLDRDGVGGICLHGSGGLVLSGSSVVHWRDGEERPLVGPDDVPDRRGGRTVGFNDLVADGDGCVVVGVLRNGTDGSPTSGELLRVTGPHEVTVLHDDIHPNGLAFSADGRRLFASDTFGGRIVVFDCPRNGMPVPVGEISTSGIRGFPDGLATDEDDGIWAAFYRGACVVRFDAGGKDRDELAVPALKPLSLCFGGHDMRTLTVVTGADGEGRGETGSVLTLPVAVAGSPVAVATI